MSRGLEQGVLGLRRIPQIALEIDEGGILDRRLVDIGRGEILAGAEIGIHRPLAIRRHEDEAAGRGGAFGCGRGIEFDAHRANVVGEDLAQAVALDLADEGRLGAERGRADDRIGRRSAGSDRRRIHQPHRGFPPAARRSASSPPCAGVALQKIFVGLGDDVDDRIAEAEHVEAAVETRVSLSKLCGGKLCGIPPSARQGKQAGAGPQRSSGDFGLAGTIGAAQPDIERAGAAMRGIGFFEADDDPAEFRRRQPVRDSPVKNAARSFRP